MASLKDFWNAIRAELIAITALPAAQVFLDVAAEGTVGNVAKGVAEGAYDVAISIFDGRFSRDTTRWAPFVASAPVTTPTKATITQSSNAMDPGGDAILTVGQDPSGFIVEDAIGLTIWNGADARGQSAIVALPGETPRTLAGKLVAKINGDPLLSEWISAQQVNENIIVRNLTGKAVTLRAAAGNDATQLLVLGTSERCCMVVLWARTAVLRDQYGEMINAWAARKQAAFGVQMSDGSWARIKRNSDMPGRDTHLADIYRWTFYLDCEMSAMDTDVLWSVLAIDQDTDAGVIN